MHAVRRSCLANDHPSHRRVGAQCRSARHILRIARQDRCIWTSGQTGVTCSWSPVCRPRWAGARRSRNTTAGGSTRFATTAQELNRPATVMEMSTHLFSARVQGAMADSETFAHLEHLRLLGEMEQRHNDGVFEYVLTACVTIRALPPPARCLSVVTHRSNPSLGCRRCHLYMGSWLYGCMVFQGSPIAAAQGGRERTAPVRPSPSRPHC